MKELHVSIERNGEMLPVGTITGEDSSTARFRYADTYRIEMGMPVSISFPTALHESAEELDAKGYPKAKEITRRILASAGIKSILSRL